MSWLESHQELRDHPKTARLRRRLGVSLPTAIGHLHLLWWWVYDYAPRGDLRRFSDQDLADAATWTEEPEAFVSALIESGFMTEDRRLVVAFGPDTILRGHGHRHALGEPTRSRSLVRRAWESMARRVKPVILARDGHACVICGAEYLLEVDHIVPIARGGTNAPQNLRTLCKTCNRRKGVS